MGLLVLIGWQTNSVILKQVLPVTVAMNPMAAVAFLLSGFAFFQLLQHPATTNKRRIAILLSLFVIVIAALRIVAIFNWFDAGIDRFVVDRRACGVQLTHHHHASATGPGGPAGSGRDRRGWKH